MGTGHIPAQTPEDAKKWRDGLGTVIRQLRETNRGRDVGAIAQSIADYRREFLGDPTKILSLE